MELIALIIIAALLIVLDVMLACFFYMEWKALKAQGSI